MNYISNHQHCIRRNSARREKKKATCNGFRYSMGAAILDENDPTKVLHRTMAYLLAPAAPYELAGDVPDVVFPCAALHDLEQDKVSVYYGAADTTVCMAFGTGSPSSRSGVRPNTSCRG